MRNGWRLVLVGDPRQLQAVGRGGMFTELCNTGRTIELEHVHRFEQSWEAQASLLLRQGDPRALDLYQQHDRIRAGTLEEHLDYFAQQWLQHHGSGEVTAVMASTNQQVDRINDRIQSARHDLEQLDPAGPVPIGGGEHAYVGDIVATRRNHRHLTTTSGERVRNRDLWTVTDTHDNGSLTVTPISGHGQITLLANYVTEHVRLGYAATEMGTQSDTVTTSLELASGATTCRNLYVAMTRGRRDNTVCVITDTHDPGEARDILDAILTIDRADIPATSQRRTLATQDRQHQPRCPVPDWFNRLRDDTAGQLEQARADYDRTQQQRADLDRQVAAAEQQLRRARAHVQPFNDAIGAAESALADAIGCRRSLQEQLATAKRRDRRTLQPALAVADRQIEVAAVQRDQSIETARPDRAVVTHTANRLKELRDEQWREQLFGRWLATPETIDILHDRIDALDSWHQWANGHKLTHTQIKQMNTGLYVAHDSIIEYFTLRSALFTDPTTAAIARHVQPTIARSPVPELSIG